MLENLLELLASGELSTVQDVASRLSVSADLVEQMLQDLRGAAISSLSPENAIATVLVALRPQSVRSWATGGSGA